LKDYENLRDARKGLAEYFEFYNNERPHQSLGSTPPVEVYSGKRYRRFMPMLRSWIAGHSRKPFSGCSMGKSVMEEDVMKNVRCCGAQIHLKKLIFCLLFKF